MATPTFVVRTTTAFDHLLRKLAKHHPDLPDLFATAVTILEADPYNLSRRHAIKKLEGRSQGRGQYRLRIGRWRFRYDIKGRDVVLEYCGLRREDTYRK
jgi:mRNA-degrading endonuclease RelE of RelBE toxin-antitoxin system